MTAILEVQALVKTFGGLVVLDHCSFQVRRGAITGLIGPNGAGKTTLFNVLTGFFKPDSGRVMFNGQEITGLPPHQIFQRRICRTFQIPREFREMTVLENLMFIPAGQVGERLWYPWFRPAIVRRQEAMIRDKALEVLTAVRLLDWREAYAHTLSGGQKKLLELARTMMADPELLLLDEPSAGVNPTLMEELAAYIRHLAHARGVTILLIEHDMDLVMRLCDPVIVLSEGRPLVEGSFEVVTKDPRVLEAYLGGH
ncbi:MAG: ABC transporter ATP-binding protein [Nitrospinae bacterium]|nr:ABC transporter ATP-binding protein [Nitrospinota bacterium]